jgi:hypothetical protein
METEGALPKTWIGRDALIVRVISNQTPDDSTNGDEKLSGISIDRYRMIEGRRCRKCSTSPRNCLRDEVEHPASVSNQRRFIWRVAIRSRWLPADRSE